MAKKFGKVLLLTAAIGSAVGAICYFLKKKDAAKDTEEEDYDDFDASDEKACAKSSNYVPLNPETKADDEAPSDSAAAKEASDSFTPLAEHVAQAAEKAEETVEEFFDEEDSSDEEPPINDN